MVGSGKETLLDVVLGSASAFMGGFPFSTFGAAPVTEFSFHRMVVTTIDTVAVHFVK